MAKADIAALLALCAAVFIAFGDVLHQRSAQQVPDAAVRRSGLFLQLLKDRGWWLGTAVAAIGFGFQAAALGVGSVLLVQALLVTSLLFALPLSARAARRRVTRWEWGWAVLLAAAVAVIVTIGNPTAGRNRASLDDWLVVTAILVPVLVLSLVCAGRSRGAVAAVLYGVVSGSLWGVFAVLTKSVVTLLGQAPVALLRAPELYAWAMIAVAGTVWQQSSFRAGAMTASLPTMTVAEPVVASVLGVVLLGEAFRADDLGRLALVVAVVVMVAAIVELARGQANADTPQSAPAAD